MKQETANKTTLLLLVLFISAIFLSMIRHFLMAILLAGIFSAMFSPLYKRLCRKLGGRKSLASLVTLVIVVFLDHNLLALNIFIPNRIGYLIIFRIHI